VVSITREAAPASLMRRRNRGGLGENEG